MGQSSFSEEASKAVLEQFEFILSPNNRIKLVLCGEHDLSLFIDELNFSMLLLSYSPKSEQAWSHRRWVMKEIAEKFQGLYDIIGKESEFVRRIAEKSKMNYRAWSYCCWLIHLMNEAQIFDELNKSKNWAELHIADNCCFHYRRRLMLNLLTDNTWEDDKESPTIYKGHFLYLLKEELEWNMHLIKQYMGREALWLHRRFLSYYWIKQFTDPNESDFHVNAQSTVNIFLEQEIEFVQTCIDIPVDEFEDTQAQAQHAATYMLWISKIMANTPEYEFQDRLKEMGDLKAILIKTSPEKFFIWERLLDHLPGK